MVMLTSDSALVRVNVFDTRSTSSTAVMLSSGTLQLGGCARYWTCQSCLNWSSPFVGWFQDVLLPTAALMLSCVRICVGWTDDCFTSIGILSASRSIASIIT